MFEMDHIHEVVATPSIPEPMSCLIHALAGEASECREHGSRDGVKVNLRSPTLTSLEQSKV